MHARIGERVCASTKDTSRIHDDFRSVPLFLISFSCFSSPSTDTQHSFTVFTCVNDKGRNMIRAYILWNTGDGTIAKVYNKFAIWRYNIASKSAGSSRSEGEFSPAMWLLVTFILEISYWRMLMLLRDESRDFNAGVKLDLTSTGTPDC